MESYTGIIAGRVYVFVFVLGSGCGFDHGCNYADLCLSCCLVDVIVRYMVLIEV